MNKPAELPSGFKTLDRWLSAPFRLARTDPYAPSLSASSGGIICFAVGVGVSWRTHHLSVAGSWYLTVLLTALTAAMCAFIAWIGRTARNWILAEVFGLPTAVMTVVAIYNLNSAGRPAVNHISFWLVSAMFAPAAYVFGARVLAPSHGRRSPSR